MSAWCVESDHIDYLISAALRYDGQYIRIGKLRVIEDPTEAGRRLVLTNRLSVAYRYDEPIDGELPGPTKQLMATDYTFSKVEHRLIDIPTTFKAVFCYKYQSCEHPDWQLSAEKLFCEHLIHAAASALEGYEAADAWPWLRSEH